MTPPSRPLHVVVVSSEIPLLHEISWMLEAVGYTVHATADAGREALWRRYAIADFVIVDGRDVSEPTGETFDHDSDDPQYRLFLYNRHGHTDFAAWYAAGAHDALQAPVSRGELLARLRTGARYLEFERRMRHRSSRSAVPGMDSRRGLLQKIRKLQESGTLGSTQHTMLVTSIDWYAGIRHRNGENDCRTLVSALAGEIRRSVGENSVSAYFGEGRFVALLAGHSPSSAKTVAESLSQSFGARESHPQSIARSTLSSAIMPWISGSTAEGVLNAALETHRLAENSGGDCVVVHSDFSHKLASWREEMAAGNPFANVVAQDIMDPFPALLERDTNQGELAAALCRSGVPVRPYVDHGGRLLGVDTRDSSGRDTQADPATGTDLENLSMPETVPHDATFAEIYDAFSSRSCSTLVVTADDHPLGYITCDGFLSMIDPIRADSFAYTDKAADDLAYVAVPSTVRETEAVEASGV